jgi:hypothetical protein
MFDYRARKLYAHAHKRGKWSKLLSTLKGRPCYLRALNETGNGYATGFRRRPGIQLVPIDHIRGSEGRSRDFDCSFYPVRDHNQERWLGVATARQEEKSLPPVELIQVGDVYFVRDGHHRISVARALGQPVIEAEVWA